jgi:hypothetical protein
MKKCTWTTLGIRIIRMMIVKRAGQHREKSTRKKSRRFLCAWKVKINSTFRLSPTTYLGIQRVIFIEIQEEFGEGRFFLKIKTLK